MCQGRWLDAEKSDREDLHRWRCAYQFYTQALCARVCNEVGANAMEWLRCWAGSGTFLLGHKPMGGSTGAVMAQDHGGKRSGRDLPRSATLLHACFGRQR